MGTDCFGTGVVFACFQKDDRFFRRNFTGNAHEARSILDAFDIHGNHLDILFFSKIFEHVGFSNIHLVAKAGKMGESDLGIDDQVDHTAANSTGLRNKRNRSGGRNALDES